MSHLQDIMRTIYLQLDTLKVDYPNLSVVYGFPETAPAGMVIALEHDKTKVDEQYELSGYRKRPRVFFADIYTTTQEDRNNLCEAVKDLFENKNLPVLNAAQQDTGITMVGDGVRVEVDLTQRFKARAKLYLYTLVD